MDGDHVPKKNVLVLTLVSEFKGNASTLKKTNGRPFPNCLDDARTPGSRAWKGHKSPGQGPFPDFFTGFLPSLEPISLMICMRGNLLPIGCLNYLEYTWILHPHLTTSSELLPETRWPGMRSETRYPLLIASISPFSLRGHRRWGAGKLLLVHIPVDNKRGSQVTRAWRDLPHRSVPRTYGQVEQGCCGHCSIYK